MQNKISESGIIGNDGKMRLPMDRLNAFCAAHKGKRILVRIEAVERGSSAAQQAYYFNYIIPTIREALLGTGERLTLEQTERWLFRQFVSDCDSVHELGISEMSDYLEQVKQFAAEHLDVYIEDPKSI